MRLEAALLLFVALGAGCSSESPGRPPESQVLIGWEWFQCDLCGSAEGGMYSKGSVEQDHTAAAEGCVHRWRPISKEDFRRRFVDSGRSVPPYAR